MAKMAFLCRSVFILICLLTNDIFQAQESPHISYQYTRYRLPAPWMRQQMQQAISQHNNDYTLQDKLANNDNPAAKDEGSFCRRSSDGHSGFCTVLYQCLQVIREHREQGVKIDVCSYKRDLPLVCCPEVDENIKEQRISAVMCKEYNAKAKNLNLHAQPTLSGKKCVSSIPLVVGGTATRLREFPHMTALGWTGNSTANGSKDDKAAVARRKIKWECGGALISELFVLTAAHCAAIGNQPPDIVRLGTRQLAAKTPAPTQQDITILIIIMHPDYRTSSNYHDIALVKLTKSAVLNENVQPACLWQFASLNMSTLVATGWGRTGYLAAKSDMLLKVDLELIQQEQCKELYPKERRLALGLINQQFCAGDMAGGKDTCQGDSGGPLHVLVPEYNCVNFVAGITSFGKFCGAANSPGVYTKVFEYLSWIEEIVFDT